MKYAIFAAFLLVGCHKGALVPDELEVWGAHSELDGSSGMSRVNERWTVEGQTEGQAQTLGLGLVWYLAAPSEAEAEAIRDLTREMHLWREAEEVRAHALTAAMVEPEPEPEPAPVKPGFLDDELAQLITAGSVLLLAAAGWFGRKHIPGVKRLGKK